VAPVASHDPPQLGDPGGSGDGLAAASGGCFSVSAFRLHWKDKTSNFFPEF
jgi:hypothetical protein